MPITSLMVPEGGIDPHLLSVHRLSSEKIPRVVKPVYEVIVDIFLYIGSKNEKR